MAAKNTNTNIELVVINNQPTITSNQLAEDFGKRHDAILRKIQTLDCSEEFHHRNFVVMVKNIKIGNGATRETKTYQITKDGFTYLAMGFTGSKAAKFKEVYIAAFNKMEETLRSPALSLLSAPVSNATPIMYQGTIILMIHQAKGDFVSLQSLCEAAQLDYRRQTLNVKKQSYNVREIVQNGENVLCLSYQSAIEWLKNIRPEKIQLKKRHKVVAAMLGLPSLLEQAKQSYRQQAQAAIALPHKKEEKRSMKSAVADIEKILGEKVIVITLKQVKEALSINGNPRSVMDMCKMNLEVTKTLLDESGAYSAKTCH